MGVRGHSLIMSRFFQHFYPLPRFLSQSITPSPPQIIMSHLSKSPFEEAWFPNNNTLHGYYVTNGNIKNKVIDNKVYEHIMNE